MQEILTLAHVFTEGSGCRSLGGCQGLGFRSEDFGRLGLQGLGCRF